MKILSNNENIIAHINVFHNLMIDILRRRAIFRAFENNLKNKSTEEKILGNAFVSFYSMDYVRAQLVDLRKFFETDKSSFKVSTLVKFTENNQLKISHKKLFDDWSIRFKNQVNKIIAHIDIESRFMVKEISKNDIDEFIDKMNYFLDQLIYAFEKTGNKIVLDRESRDLNGEFLNTEQEDQFREYLNYACKS